MLGAKYKKTTEWLDIKVNSAKALIKRAKNKISLFEKGLKIIGLFTPYFPNKNNPTPALENQQFYSKRIAISRAYMVGFNTRPLACFNGLRL